MNFYLGQILLVPYNFAPKGFALCNGQLLPISSNTALFSLLGTYYGGDGKSSFGLPNLQGTVPVGIGNNGTGINITAPGEAGGETNVILVIPQIPAHTHTLMGTAAPENSSSAAAGTFASAGRGRQGTYVPATTQNPVNMNPGLLTPAGGSQPHNNVQPTLVMNYVIALQGVFPTRP